MKGFFSRHAKNKNTPPEKGNGMISDYLWGSSKYGKPWIERELTRIERYKNSNTKKKIPIIRLPS
jgi:hypothetical protein